MAAQPALLQAVRQQRSRGPVSRVVEALGPIEAAVGQAGGGGRYLHALHRKAHPV